MNPSGSPLKESGTEELKQLTFKGNEELETQGQGSRDCFPTVAKIPQFTASRLILGIFFKSRSVIPSL